MKSHPIVFLSHANQALHIMKERFREGYAIDWQVSHSESNGTLLLILACECDEIRLLGSHF